MRPPFAIQLQTPYGAFLMNRHDAHQPGAILSTGRPHIDAEIRHIQALAGLLDEGAVAIDAGANIGLVAVPLAQALADRGGTVIAFEPQRLVYYMLAGNTAHAGLTNLVCRQVALGRECGSVTVPQLDPHADADFGQVSLAHAIDAGEDVPLLTIDALDLHRLDLIKIDVERMELAVLAGGEATIAAHRPVIWIEIWPDQYSSVYPWLSERGYELSAVDALNFIAVPGEKSERFGHTFPRFGGLDNPFYPEEPTLP